MKPDPECVPCLLKRVLFQSRLVEGEEGHGPVSAALEEMASAYPGAQNSARMASLVHRKAYDALGVADPYHGLKVRSDEVAEILLPHLLEAIESSEDRLEAAVIGSIVGNIMDFGPGIAIQHPDELIDAFHGLMAQGLDVNHVDELRRRLDGGATVLYLFDNCGESVFDRILITEIKALGNTVVGLVKGQPILTDVTRDDAARAGLDKVLDRIVDTGQFAIGVDLSTASEGCRSEFEAAEVIISKGMANFEALSDEDVGEVFYLMRAKCDPVAKALGVRKEDNVAMLWDGPGGKGRWSRKTDNL